MISEEVEFLSKERYVRELLEKVISSGGEFNMYSLVRNLQTIGLSIINIDGQDYDLHEITSNIRDLDGVTRNAKFFATWSDEQLKALINIQPDFIKFRPLANACLNWLKLTRDTLVSLSKAADVPAALDCLSILSKQGYVFNFSFTGKGNLWSDEVAKRVLKGADLFTQGKVDEARALIPGFVFDLGNVLFPKSEVGKTGNGMTRLLRKVQGYFAKQ